MVQKTETIYKYFLRLLIPIVLVVSISMSALFAWNDYQTNRSSRLSSQNLIFKTFAAVIRQPLLQGSLVEAKIRSDELVQNPQLRCIDILTPSERIESCAKNISPVSRNLNKIEEQLFFSAENTNSLGQLTITFDNTDLVTNVWKDLGKNVIGFVLLAVILFFTLRIGFSKITNELDKLMKAIESGDESLNSLPSFTISEFLSIAKRLKGQFEVSKAAAEAKVALGVARQVAHDIRSPVLGLQMVIHAAKNQMDPKISTAIIDTAQRISDIANDVIEHHTPCNQISGIRTKIQKEPMAIVKSLREIIGEKNLIFQTTSKSSILFRSEGSESFVDMRVSDFKRVISNLLDNSIHAIQPSGEITVTYTENNESCEIVIEDSGKGIPADVLERVIKTGGTFGKVGGKGLGLQWAIRKIADVKGLLKVNSVFGEGTKIFIVLPKVYGCADEKMVLLG